MLLMQVAAVVHALLLAGLLSQTAATTAVEHAWQQAAAWSEHLIQQRPCLQTCQQQICLQPQLGILMLQALELVLELDPLPQLGRTASASCWHPAAQLWKRH